MPNLFISLTCKNHRVTAEIQWRKITSTVWLKKLVVAQIFKKVSTFYETPQLMHYFGLKQIISVHSFTRYFFKIHFNAVLPFTSRSPKKYIIVRF